MPKKSKMGRPPTGKAGKVLSFNCKFDNIAWCEQLKSEAKFSKMINYLIELERETGEGLDD